MESEIDLNVAIQELHAIATVPHLYNILIELQAVDNFIQLMNHENTDISCAVVHLLQVSFQFYRNPSVFSSILPLRRVPLNELPFMNDV